MHEKLKKGDRVKLNKDLDNLYFKKGKCGIVSWINDTVDPHDVKVKWISGSSSILSIHYFDYVKSDADKIKELGEEALKILE